MIARLIAFLLVLCFCRLQADDELLIQEVPTTVWNLRIGHRFSVQTVVEQETTIRSADRDPIVISRQETYVFHYHISLTRNGQSNVSVSMEMPHIVVKKGIQPTEKQLQELAQLTWKLRVAADGSPDQRQVAELPLPIGDTARSRKLLVDSRSSESLVSLSEQPFWVAPNIIGDKPAWKRELVTPLGPYGSLRSLVRLKPAAADNEDGKASREAADEPDDGSEAFNNEPDENPATESDPNRKVSIEVSAESRFIPAAIAQEGTLIRYTDPKFEMKDFAGIAEMLLPEETADENPDASKRVQRRPWFESLNLSWITVGEVDVTVGTRKRRLQIEQKHRQKSRLVRNEE